MGQFRESELVREILNVWGEGTKVACEFGIQDGLSGSNTAMLFDGWNVTLLEAQQRYEDEIRKKRPDAKVIMTRVTPENVNELLPESLDLLSIDIDGNDYHVWEAVKQSPRIVIIESNPQRSNWIMPRDDSFSMNGIKHDYYGASPDKLIELGERKGYRLAATTGVNMIFVRNDCPALDLTSDLHVPKYTHLEYPPPNGSKRIKMEANCVIPEDKANEQIAHALKLGLQEFEPVKPHDKELIIIGSGPSVRAQSDVIRWLITDRNLYSMVCHSAHDFLIEERIIPDYAVSVDPLSKVKDSFKRPQFSTTYFLASQTHADVFEHLKDRHVVLFHLLTGMQRHEILRGKLLVNGGTTTGSRALYLGWLMGFRKFHLFGFDSCLSGDLLKVNGEKVAEGKAIIPIWANGKEFLCNAAMARQAYEFEQLVNFLPDVQVKVYGEGLIPHIAAECAKVDSIFLDKHTPFRETHYAET